MLHFKGPKAKIHLKQGVIVLEYFYENLKQ